MVKRYYQIGNTKIAIHMPKEMNMPKNMGLFEVEADDTSVPFKTYYLEFADRLDQLEQRICKGIPNSRDVLRKNMKIYMGREREGRVLYFEGNPIPYALYIEETEQIIRTYVNRDVNYFLNVDTIFVSLLGLEKVMIQQNSLILHCAYMCKDGKAILFSAPSGTGKSTQADLWERYRGTRTINGDKALLIRKEDGWYAYGWPICGSSEICHNESYPVQAIVMLYQNPVNEVKKLSGLGAMKKLLAQVTMNMWNTEFQTHAMDMLEQLIGEVPIYELGCNISEEAVQCLEQVL